MMRQCHSEIVGYIQYIINSEGNSWQNCVIYKRTYKSETWHICSSERYKKSPEGNVKLTPTGFIAHKCAKSDFSN